jgi:glutaminase
MPLIKPAGSESPILNYLERLHGNYADLLEGKIADYIPELAKADRNWFAICLATIDGQVYEVGNSRQLFTIQSISKPFVYGLALEDHGEPTALQKVGVEPTGDAFNSISLDPQTGRPLNPMINAGAIAVAGLVRGSTPDEKRARVLQAFSCYAGRELTIDDVVYQSEKSTGHRNRAIGHMLRNFDILSDDPEPVLDLYFQQCSIAVHCRDLAVMAASLANGGVNPLTGQRAVQQENVARMLSIMVSCGMYDYAGEWMYRVGMPAKSGVSGGILAVLPGQLGIGVFSPPLDAQGNSVRGIRVCHEISRSFHLHLFHAPQVTRSVIRACYDATKIRSRRLRNAEESQVLQTRGDRIKIYELQG